MEEKEEKKKGSYLKNLECTVLCVEMSLAFKTVLEEGYNYLVKAIGYHFLLVL